MNPYQNMRNPKKLRESVKFVFLYVKDAAIIFGLLYFGFLCQAYIPMTLRAYISLEVLLFSLGVFLCMPSAQSTNNRMFMLLLAMFLRDRKKYISVDYAHLAGLKDKKEGMKQDGTSKNQ